MKIRSQMRSDFLFACKSNSLLESKNMVGVYNFPGGNLKNNNKSIIVTNILCNKNV